MTIDEFCLRSRIFAFLIHCILIIFRFGGCFIKIDYLCTYNFIKKYFIKKFLFLMSLALIVFSSCGKDSDEQNTPHESLSSLTEVINVDASDSGLEIVINSSADWTASSNVAWCKIPESAGKAGTSMFAFSFEKNWTSYLYLHKKLSNKH